MLTSPSAARSLDCLYVLIQERIGLRVSDTQVADVVQVLQDAMASLQLREVEQLLPILARESLKHPLWRALIHVTTVGETYFFRNQDQFSALRTDVLPALIEARRQDGQKQIRLWSAGCATGEEPYSLAILLRELLPDFETWHIALLATDINLTSLERARQGIYRKWSFREETPADIHERWFTVDGDNHQLDASIRSSVIFQPLNLVSDTYPSFASGTMNMDLILCRNVTIYFHQTTTSRILSRFCTSLSNGGWLVVGHAEPLPAPYAGLTPRNFPHAVLYQKVVTESAPVTPMPPTAAVVTSPLPDHRREAPSGPRLREVKSATGTPTRSGSAEPVLGAQAALQAATASDNGFHGSGDEESNAASAWQRAKQAADAGDWQDALIQLARAEEENKFQAQVYHLRGLIQWQIGDTGGALTSLRQALYCDTSFALAHYALGEIHEASGRSRQASRCWRLAQSSIADMQPDDHLPFADDMTVRMLQELLAHRLTMLAKKT